VDNDFSKNLQLRENNCINFLRRIKNTTYTCFSGGKDSLVALDLAVRSGIKKIVFCDTTIELQETLDYIDEVENYYNLKIERVSAPRSFFELVYDIGFPSRSMRWCCKVFKFSPLAIFAREKRVKSYITGLRKEENTRRRNYNKIDQNPFIKVRQINPILNWSEGNVWAYIHKHGLPVNPLYELGFKRIGCWPCPFKSKDEWNLIEKHFPEHYKLLQKTLKIILKDCEGIGIDDLNDFIINFKWTGYTRPQNSELKGKIEIMPESTFIHLKNSLQLEKLKNVIPILSNKYKIIRNSIVINKKLRRQSVKILVEKALNCVGCGACVALCNSLSLKDNSLVVDEKKCNSCLKCLNTSVMKGACIMRNFAPFRFEVGTCRNASFEMNCNDRAFDPNSRIGLIRTRMKIETLEEKFKDFTEIRKNKQYLSLINKKFAANAYKSNGFVEIRINPKNHKLEDAMNFTRRIMAQKI